MFEYLGPHTQEGSITYYPFICRETNCIFKEFEGKFGGVITAFVTVATATTGILDSSGITKSMEDAVTPLNVVID
jgi:hypothetical protein